MAEKGCASLCFRYCSHHSLRLLRKRMRDHAWVHHDGLCSYKAIIEGIDMQDEIDMLMGIDKRKEIFDLWYEVSFLRHLMTLVASQIPESSKYMTDEIFELARNSAQAEVRHKFPSCMIEFTKPSVRKEECSDNIPQPLSE